jgi:hypothetical protein
MKFLKEQSNYFLPSNTLLSRAFIAEFLASLAVNESKPNFNFVSKACEILNFTKGYPIPMAEVQRVFLLACMKEMMGNEYISYVSVADTFGLGSSGPSSLLKACWAQVVGAGGISEEEFNKKLLEFYLAKQEKSI